MDGQTPDSGSRFCEWLGRWYLAVAVVVGFALVGLIEYRETDRLTTHTPFEQLFVFELNGYANLLLIASTVLYVCHLWLTSEAVGRWASRLATLGALAAVLALLTRWLETYLLQRGGHIPLNHLYEVMALFSAITVVIYLIMERVYQTRSAGAFVMLIVLGSVLFQIWLAAHEEAIPGSRIRVLRSYWMYAHVLGNFIGYGAFAVAAAMGAAYLVRHHAEHHGRGTGIAVRSLPELHRIEASMDKAVMLGFPVFTLATILGSMWAYQAWGRYWAWDPKETWALIVWVTYASYFIVRYVKQWSGRRMAWWAIGGFQLTIFCFLGASALWPGLHSYP
ncbi:MAG TPA: c-type cytochrome biogenesis protein CcsB [Noviherbaspirillum sp.]|nr:c-type cytochrome biogenesis protein CcsB [Noviherbaspirillum sp.]